MIVIDTIAEMVEDMEDDMIVVVEVEVGDMIEVVEDTIDEAIGGVANETKNNRK
jgi:hypothetical protein